MPVVPVTYIRLGGRLFHREKIVKLTIVHSPLHLRPYLTLTYASDRSHKYASRRVYMKNTNAAVELAICLRLVCPNLQETTPHLLLAMAAYDGVIGEE